MAYDIHVVRTTDWLDSAQNPIFRDEVDRIVADDPELEWSSNEFVDMSDDTGIITRYFMIRWKGHPTFWWYRDQILCSGPSESQIMKLVDIAARLAAIVVGDDGESYSAKRSWFGKSKLVITQDGQL